MREISLDATSWKRSSDFYAALLPAIGAPAWHGDSVNALVDSMITGGINKLKPPYVVRVHNMGGVPADVADPSDAASLRDIAPAIVGVTSMMLDKVHAGELGLGGGGGGKAAPSDARRRSRVAAST